VFGAANIVQVMEYWQVGRGQNGELIMN